MIDDAGSSGNENKPTEGQQNSTGTETPTSSSEPQELTWHTLPVRDGCEKDVPARDLVPGDVILLSTGDKVPADARLFQSFNLMAEEAPLTGESIPVSKLTSTLVEHELPVGDRRKYVCETQGRFKLCFSTWKDITGEVLASLSFTRNSRRWPSPIHPIL